MRELLLEVIRAGLPLALLATLFSQGLMLTPGRQMAFIRERPLLMLWSMAVVVILVPVAALIVVVLLRPSPPVSIALAILAASPAAPFQLVNIAKKGGSLVYLTALHLSLSLCAVVTVPLTLDVLAEALGFQADVAMNAVARTVGTMVLLPVGVGLLVRATFPAAAERTGAPLGRVAEVALYVLLVPVLIATFGLLLKLDLWSYFVMAVFIIVNLGMGLVLGPHNPNERTTLAMESGARNIGLALTIAVLNFNRERALPVLVPYIIMFVLISSIFLRWRSRQPAG
jgi:BASS family bile acid:Na+ symporter